MGGWNSGRRSGYPAVEDGLTIDLPLMLRRGWLPDGASASGSQYGSRNDEWFASVGHSFDMRDPASASLSLSFTWTPSGGEPQRVPQRIALFRRRPIMEDVAGGCSARSPATPLPSSAFHRAAAGLSVGLAWRLPYRSQRPAHRDRPFEKLFRLQRELCSYEGWEAGLRRPKGMWRRTYKRHSERYWEVDAERRTEIAALVLRLGGRL